MSNYKMHNVRFYKPKTRAVYCMALQYSEKKLATSRSDASIEIWNLSHSPFIERTIACTTDNFSIEGLAWCKDRLFSVGLHGLLIEYDVVKLNIKNKLVITGEAAFCLDINKAQNEIAIGTEQGYLNIFQITETEVLFHKFLDKQEGRILCLKYDHSGQYIISGGMDAIRIWNVQSGHALHKMTTGRSETNKPTIVWTVDVTKDLTIISGDSRGKLTFWDGNVGAQIESYQSHRADILSLCLSDDENSMYCAGVDPNIIYYTRVSVKEGTHKWVKSIQRKIHDHDVRTLALLDDKLYSSGVDGYLACSYHPPKTLLKYPPILQSPCVSVCTMARYIMLRYPKYIEIWSLGESDLNEKHHSLFPLKTEPKKLVVLQKIVTTDAGKEKKEGIICSAMSPDGKWIIFSTRLGIRLFNLVFEDEKPKLIPCESFEQQETPCINCVFSQRNHLIIALNNGGMRIYELKENKPELIQNINTESKIKDTITFLTVSNCGKYVVAGDSRSNVVVWILKSKEYKFLYQLPKYKSSPTALQIHPTAYNLVIAYADNNIAEYDLKKCKLTEFSRGLTANLPKQWLVKPYPVRNVTFDARAAHIIILHDDNSIIVINKEKKIPKIDSKIPKIDASQLIDDCDSKIFKSYQHAFHLIKKYKHLVHLSWLSDDEMVAVEVNPLSLIEQLPPCFIQNTFGRK